MSESLPQCAPGLVPRSLCTSRISPDAVDASDAEDGDTRRITEYAQTSETHRPPIVLPHLPVQPRKTEDL